MFRDREVTSWLKFVKAMDRFGRIKFARGCAAGILLTTIIGLLISAEIERGSRATKHIYEDENNEGQQ